MLTSNSLNHLWENLKRKPQGYCREAIQYHLGQAGLNPQQKGIQSITI